MKDEGPPEDIIKDETTTTTLVPTRIKQWELTSATSTVRAASKKVADAPLLKLCIVTLAVLPAYRRSGIGKCG